MPERGSWEGASLAYLQGPRRPHAGVREDLAAVQLLVEAAVVPRALHGRVEEPQEASDVRGVGVCDEGSAEGGDVAQVPREARVRGGGPPVDEHCPLVPAQQRAVAGPRLEHRESGP